MEGNGITNKDMVINTGKHRLRLQKNHVSIEKSSEIDLIYLRITIYLHPTYPRSIPTINPSLYFSFVDSRL
jgi:hypothetical protein